MMKKVLLLLALLGLIFLMWCCVYKHRAHYIQQDISDRTQQALEQANMQSFTRRVDGRDVYLSASGVGESQKMFALELIENIWGVRKVVFEGTVDNSKEIVSPEIPLLPTATIDAQYDGNKIILSGRLASQADIDTLLNDIKAKFGQDITIDNSLTIGSDDSSLTILTEGFDKLSRLSSGQLSLNAQTVSLTGEAATLAIQQGTRDAFEQLSDDYSDFNFNTDLQVAAAYDNQACQNRLNEIINSSNIRFQSGKANIRSDSFPLLKRISLAAQRCEAGIHIKGHTDSQGKAAFNLYLSQQRAESVKQYLLNSGVPASRIKASGFGETQPIADNTTAAGRALNRRIEFNVE